MGAVFFFSLGTAESSMLVVGACFTALFVLLMVLSRMKKSTVRKKYDELDQLKMKAISLL